MADPAPHDVPDARPDATASSSRVRRALRRITPGFVRRGSRRVTDADVERVAERADELTGRFGQGGPLGRFVEDGKLLVLLVRDYAAGRYRAIPFWSVAAVVFTLLYLLNPLDLIPDAIPVIGQIDDAAVLSTALVMVEQDLRAYKAWREGDAG